MDSHKPAEGEGITCSLTQFSRTQKVPYWRKDQDKYHYINKCSYKQPLFQDRLIRDWQYSWSSEKCAPRQSISKAKQKLLSWQSSKIMWNLNLLKIPWEKKTINKQNQYPGARCGGSHLYSEHLGAEATSKSVHAIGKSLSQNKQNTTPYHTKQKTKKPNKQTTQIPMNSPILPQV